MDITGVGMASVYRSCQVFTAVTWCDFRLEFMANSSSFDWPKEHIPISVRGYAGHHSVSSDSNLWWSAAWLKSCLTLPVVEKNLSRLWQLGLIWSWTCQFLATWRNTCANSFRIRLLQFEIRLIMINLKLIYINFYEHLQFEDFEVSAPAHSSRMATQWLLRPGPQLLDGIEAVGWRRTSTGFSCCDLNPMVKSEDDTNHYSREVGCFSFCNISFRPIWCLKPH